MDKFERIGCNNLYNCINVAELNNALSWSCKVCCNSQRSCWHECNKCAIQFCHDSLVAIHQDRKAKEKEQEQVRK